MKPVPSILRSLPLSSSFRLLPGYTYIFELEQCLLENLFRWALFNTDSEQARSPKRNLKRLETAARELQFILGDEDLKNLPGDQTVVAVKKKVTAIENTLAEERKQRTAAETLQAQLESLQEELDRTLKQTRSLESRLLLSKQQQENLEVIRRKVQILKVLREAILEVCQLRKRQTTTKDDGHDKHSNGKDQEADSIG